MAISFRAASALVGEDAGSSLVLAAPAGTVSTDVLLACIEYDGGTGITWTPPTGWTLVNRTDGTTTSGTIVYWGLGNVASLSFTNTSTTAIGWVLGYIGVNNSTPMDVAASGQANASSTTGMCPSLTTVTNGAWGVCVCGFNAALPTFSGQTFTERQNGNGGAADDPQGLDTGDFIQSVAGATGTHTTASSVAGVNQGITLALRPATPIAHYIGNQTISY